MPGEPARQGDRVAINELTGGVNKLSRMAVSMPALEMERKLRTLIRPSRGINLPTGHGSIDFVVVAPTMEGEVAIPRTWPSVCIPRVA